MTMQSNESCKVFHWLSLTLEQFLYLTF